MDGYITILNIIERLIKKDGQKEKDKQKSEHRSYEADIYL